MIFHPRRYEKRLGYFCPPWLMMFVEWCSQWKKLFWGQIKMFYANKKNNKFSKLKIDWYVILQEKCYVLKLCFQTNPPHWIAAWSAVGQEPSLGQKKKTGKQHRQGILSALILLTRARNRFCQRTAQRSRSRNIYNRLRDQTLYVKNPNPFLHTHSLSNTGFTRAALPEV